MRSPFTGLHLAGLNLKNIFGNKKAALAICGVALIPLVYGGLFLTAFFDPYGSLTEVPAAVVNLDKGAVINDESKNVGDELCDQLEETAAEALEGQPGGFDWKFVSEEEATKGLEDGTYYMVLIIPEDFSESIASASSSSPVQANLKAYFNPSTNLIATTVGQSMVTSLRSKLTTSIQEQYYATIFTSIEEISDSVKTASDGATELADGISDAADGSATITENLGTLKDGSEELTEGISTLSEGSNSLTSGLGTLSSGSNELTDGLGDLSTGTESLASGASQVDDGAKQVSSGASELASGTQQLSDQTSTLGESVAQLNSGAATLSAGLTQLATSIGALYDGSNTITNGLTSLKGAITQLAEGATSLSTNLTSLKTGASTLETGVASMYGLLSTYGVLDSLPAETKAQLDQIYNLATEKTVSNGLGTAASGSSEIADNLNNVVAKLGSADSASTLIGGSTTVTNGLKSVKTALGDENNASTLVGGSAALAAGLSQLNDSVPTLTNAIQQINGGAQQLSSGASSLASGTSSLSSGASTVATGAASAYEGSKQISEGAESALSGSQQISDGLESAKSGSETITDGASKLEEGSQELTDGLDTAKDGSDELATGLEDGYGTISESTENSDEKVSMMSDPVTANGDDERGETITIVKNYGTGFAPYFIGLALWVGALMLSMMMKSFDKRALMSKAPSISAVLSGYIPMALMSIIQMVILLAFLQFVLGFTVNYVFDYYAFGILVSLAFTAIVQFCRASMGTVGMVVIVILLMLQLTTAGGTFPVEASPSFFEWISPYLPMTYVVQGFRMAMCGLSTTYMTTSIIVLAVFTIGFLVLSTYVAHRKRKVHFSTLYPPIKISS